MNNPNQLESWVTTLFPVLLCLTLHKAGTVPPCWENSQDVSQCHFREVRGLWGPLYKVLRGVLVTWSCWLQNVGPGNPRQATFRLAVG